MSAAAALNTRIRLEGGKCAGGTEAAECGVRTVDRLWGFLVLDWQMRKRRYR